MWIFLKMPSASHISFSSGVNAMPWLGQPWGIRGVGVTFHFDFQSTLVTSTVLMIFPLATSAIKKPSKLLLLAYILVESLFSTKTRILSRKRMVLMTLRDATSEIVI